MHRSSRRLSPSPHRRPPLPPYFGYIAGEKVKLEFDTQKDWVKRRRRCLPCPPPCSQDALNRSQH